jgi:hypothetical protein
MLRKIGVLALVAGVWASIPAFVRADRLDDKLKDQVDKVVVKYLKDKGYKNVGVLPFRVQKGNKPSSFRVGPINTNLATRLENALVIFGGKTEAEAFAVIHDAGVNARQQARANAWFTGSQQQKAIDNAVAQRKKMFNTAMPMAWGQRKVKPDVLLTGLVINRGDRTRTTVRIEAIDKKTPAKLDKITEFAVATDASLVRDLGYNFALSRAKKRSAVRKRSQENDDGVLQEAKQDEKKQQQKKDPTNKPQQKTDGVATPASIAGIEFKMLVDGQPADVKQSDTQNAKYAVASPRPGQKIIFSLTNNDKERTLGVVLKLNGISTINQQKDESIRCRKWVIAPGKTFKIDGFRMLPESGQQKGGQQKGGQGNKGGQGDKQGDDDQQQKKDQNKKDQNKKDQNKKDQQDKKDQNKKGQNKKDQGGSKVKSETIPFKVLVGDEAKSMSSQLGDKAGMIEIDVFVAGAGGEDDDKSVSLRGMRQSKEKKARSSHAAYRAALLQSARAKATYQEVKDRTTGKVTKREIIVPDESAKAPGGDITVVSFDNPRAVGGLSIKITPAGGENPEPKNDEQPGGDEPKGKDPGPND